MDFARGRRPMRTAPRASSCTFDSCSRLFLEDLEMPTVLVPAYADSVVVDRLLDAGQRRPGGGAASADVFASPWSIAAQRQSSSPWDGELEQSGRSQSGRANGRVHGDSGRQLWFESKPQTSNLVPHARRSSPCPSRSSPPPSGHPRGPSLVASPFWGLIEVQTTWQTNLFRIAGDFCSKGSIYTGLRDWGLRRVSQLPAHSIRRVRRVRRVRRGRRSSPAQERRRRREREGTGRRDAGIPLACALMGLPRASVGRLSAPLPCWFSLLRDRLASDATNTSGSFQASGA